MTDEILKFIQADKQENAVIKPRINLAYAQSIDGSIALKKGQSTAISGPESLRLTHQMRAIHQAILVGIGTVLADDPQLTVRKTAGNDPQALILDSRLRFPLDAKLLANDRQVWIFCLDAHDKAKREMLETKGAKVFVVPSNQSGRINLISFLGKLRELNIESVMLEGGASVIASFLAARLIQKAIITIAPNFIGGLKVLEKPLLNNEGIFFPRIKSPKVQLLGEDLVVWGNIE